MYVREELAQVDVREADGDDDVAGIAAWSPETVLVVAADGQREAEFRAEIVDGGGFAPIVGEDGDP